MTKEERSKVLLYILIFTIMFFIVGGFLNCKNPNPLVNKEYDIKKINKI